MMKKIIAGAMLALPLAVTSVPTQALASISGEISGHSQMLQTFSPELIAARHCVIKRVYHKGYYYYANGRRHYHAAYYSNQRVCY